MAPTDVNKSVAGNDASESLASQVRDAFTAETALRIAGGGSKSRLGRAVEAEALDVTAHRGIVEYQPTELVVTARAGTPLAELEAALAESGQMLSFEPPHLGESATLGGAIACGLSGPRRPHTCSARDSTLGVKMINGRGEVLRFGGQVMKNVAGYDVSRLMVGAQGTLGVLLDISLKVLPRPACERTVFIDMNDTVAIEVMCWLAGKALPVSAACHLPEMPGRPAQLCLRLSGAEAAVDACVALIGREQAGFSIEVLEANDERANQFWLKLRERRLDFFDHEQASQSLWRLSLPPATPLFRDDEIAGDCLLDWAGAQRWLKTDARAEAVHQWVQRSGGHATLLTPQAATQAPLSPGLASVHQRLKYAFDPKGILNPGRLYEAW
jgi:glycolate oxidase FAD binding subunit